MAKYHINMDSFGSECPQNWEEIAASLNELIDAELEKEEGAFDPSDAKGLSDSGYEIIDSIWEKFCAGQLEGVPAPIFEE